MIVLIKLSDLPYDDVNFIKETHINKTIFYKKNIKDLNIIKNHFKSIEIKLTDYFIKELNKILFEYCEKNFMDFVKITYIVGTHPLCDGIGNVFIHTEKEIYLLQFRFCY